MTERNWDVIVVGLGALGSAAVCELARRGTTVLGIDQYAPPHALGSSHGGSRIIREAYFEHPLYVPLVRRAHELWRALEQESGEPLLRTTGALMIGSPEGVMVNGAVASARAHGVPHELLNAGDIDERFPGMRTPAPWVGVYEPGAGVLDPEACIRVYHRLALAAGAVLETGVTVASVDAAAGGVAVATSAGVRRAGRVVLAAGAWLSDLVPELTDVLTVTRQPSHWFEPTAPGQYAADSCPLALWEPAAGPLFYALPDLGAGVKIGIHHDGERTTAAQVSREVSEDETAHARELLAAVWPGAAGALRHAETCLYTNTPDARFLIDEHPARPAVMLCSACSGHGFKFASAIGEIVAERLTTGRHAFDLAPFRAARLFG